MMAKVPATGTPKLIDIAATRKQAERHEATAKRLRALADGAERAYKEESEAKRLRALADRAQKARDEAAIAAANNKTLRDRGGTVEYAIGDPDARSSHLRLADGF